MIKKGLLLLLTLFPVLAIAQNLANNSTITLTQSWSQEPNGYTYPLGISVPVGTVPQNGFPVCVLLHGNGGTGPAMVGQFKNTLACHILVAPTGYQNSWNICAEDSDAPDVAMITDLISQLKTYANIDSTRIRIVGSSNGGGLANRVFIENTDPGVDIVCAIVTQLNEPQYHAGGFYMPGISTDSSSTYCGYDSLVNPLSTRKYLGISNDNDPVIPYTGGTSAVGVSFLPAQDAIYEIAKNQGFTGAQLISGTPISAVDTEFSYLSGKVVHLVGDAFHGANPTQLNYIKTYFSDCGTTTGIEELNLHEVRVYPNPSNSILNVERSSNQAVSYWVYNTLGEQVLSDVSASKTLQVHLAGLPMGVYFLQIDHQTIKVLKQN